MKYYSEKDTKELRLAFEKKVLGWPHVEIKKMFGCPCYQAKGKLFAFLVTKGIVITQLQPDFRKKLSSQHQTSFFQAGKKTVRSWIRLSLEGREELDEIMPFVTESYQEALLKA